jgi:hypothetical protein
MGVEIVNAAEFTATMNRYAELYSSRHPDKGLGQIMIERARNLAIKLYEATKVIAPTQSDIAADVQKQGWNIPEKFPDGRIGRGTPDQWIGAAIKSLPKVRGRKTTERKALESSMRGSKPTLQQMQAFVIKYRTAHAGFIASGWKGALWDLGGKATGGGFGRASVNDNGSEIEIVNNAPGAAAADAKHNFTQQGIADATADMEWYIFTRLQEQRKAA